MILQSVFGNIGNPLTKDTVSGTGYGDLASTDLVKFLNNVVALIIVIAGIWTVFNFISAGYIYLNSNNQPQKLTDAGNKILQSVIGLAIVATAYTIAGILGFILFKDATKLLDFKLFEL